LLILLRNRFDGFLGSKGHDVGRQLVAGEHLGRRRDCFPHADSQHIGYGIELSDSNLCSCVAAIGIGLKDIHLLAIELIAVDGLAEHSRNLIARHPFFNLADIGKFRSLRLVIKWTSNNPAKKHDSQNGLATASYRQKEAALPPD
jgi:hypothetical protein